MNRVMMIYGKDGLLDRYLVLFDIVEKLKKISKINYVSFSIENDIDDIEKEMRAIETKIKNA